jgi:diguanylate cyclase
VNGVIKSPLVAAREAIDLMERHGLDPSPMVYAVLSAWRAQSNPDLARAIETVIDSGAPLTDKVCDELHQRFFGPGDLARETAAVNEKAIQQIQGVVSDLEAAGNRTSAYSERLVDVTRALERQMEPSRLAALLTGLARTTTEMIVQNKELTTRLNETTREMSALRDALELVRTEALSDPLTGLANRRNFDEVLKLRIAEAETFGSSLSLILCDIDHFKRFNDTWGHQTGDQVIRFIGASLQRNALSDYLVARIGGEEFALILPRTSLNDAVAFAESVRRSVETKKLLRRSTAEELGLVTISSGVGVWRRGEEAKDFIARVDAMLYASKHQGRNCVTADSNDRRTAA